MGRVLEIAPLAACDATRLFVGVLPVHRRGDDECPARLPNFYRGATGLGRYTLPRGLRADGQLRGRRHVELFLESHLDLC